MSTLTSPTSTINYLPLSTMLVSATRRNTRLDVPVTVARPRIELQSSWVAVVDAGGHHRLQMRWTVTG